MSRQSKARRDIRRKQAPARPIRRLGGTLQPHAQLVGDDGGVVGGAGFRDGEWVLVLGGKSVTATESPAMMLAMLKHAVAVQERTGRNLELHVSAALDTAATHEATAAGHSLPRYLDMLEAERVERLSESAPGAGPAGGAPPLAH
ncbi:hypothetical protein [Marilutibacter spongiae]|uniref:Uncharacterized protein n=1 Tax=Marilutibacter spongiae TaxID=2025720 RepID=A0A7W3TNB8_9GAMM|nr:hypothetical protein [Lysobacter spongiae]MBB1061224.1 hypothetical protein [Lysobacter spongiae]